MELNFDNIPEGWRLIKVGETIKKGYKYYNTSANQWVCHSRFSYNVGQIQAKYSSPRIIKDKTKEKSQWNKVFDKYPELYKNVLVCASGQIRVGRLTVGYKWRIQSWTGKTNLKVTHWKELPKLP